MIGVHPLDGLWHIEKEGKPKLRQEDPGRCHEKIAVGTGFGARWISPVGLIRIDLGFGLDRPEEERPLRLHLGIGPDF